MSPRLLYLALGLAGLVAIMLILQQTGNTLPSLGGDRFAYVLYMGIWAALIGSAVLSRPEGIGHSIKQFTVWIGIFLIVMAGYSYRYEMQDIASTISGGLIPGSPISRTTKDGQPQVTLIKDKYGNFNANGSIDGSRIVFLIDTGATEIVLSHRDAENVGINTDTLSYTIPVSTANGMTTTARARVGSLSIGDITFDRVRVMVARKGDLEGNLLGMSFINRLHSFEIRGDRMILTQ